jgi:peptide deformylase
MGELSDRVEALLAGPLPLPVVVAGDPVLRASAEPFDGQLDDDLLNRLAEAMRWTMLAAPGVGLAAPQIGIGLRVAVLEDPAAVPPEVAAARDRRPLPFTVLINPSYEPVGDDRAAFYEGCLSVPGYQAVTDRATTVRLTALDLAGRAVDTEVHGWSARIVQHECDHLDGTLYLDRAELRSLADVTNYQSRWSSPSPEAARRALGF